MAEENADVRICYIFISDDDDDNDDDDDDDDDDKLFLWYGDQQMAYSLIFSLDHYQRSSPLEISNMLQTGFEPVQNDFRLFE